MPKLNDKQLVILAAAAQRDGGLILPLPKSLKPDAAQVSRTLDALIRKQLIAARSAAREEPVWQAGSTAGRQTLVITRAGLAAVGCEDQNASEPDASKPVVTANNRQGRAAASPLRQSGKAGAKKGRPAKAKHAPSRRKAPDNPTAETLSSAKTAKHPKRRTKIGTLLALLQRREGAAMDDLTNATRWQAHSVRAALTGLRKRGVGVARERRDGITRYRVAES